MIQGSKKTATGFLHILKETNVAYSLGNDNFHGIRKGSLIQLEGDPSFITVSDNERKNFCFKFERIEDDKLLIKQDIEARLSVGDFISINVPRFEALGLSGLIEKGKGYNVGDVLQVSDGHPTLDVVNNKANNTSFEVGQLTIQARFSSLESSLRANTTNRQKKSAGLKVAKEKARKFLSTLKNVQKKRKLKNKLSKLKELLLSPSLQ
jgi:hypothetical protein